MPRLVFDAETGAVIEFPETGITGPVSNVIASTLLPGTTPELVAQWYGDWLNADVAPSEPFKIGDRVLVQSGHGTLSGKIIDRRVTDGELHSIKVLLAMGGAYWYSPRELREV